jgi:hypothetical protein
MKTYSVKEASDILGIKPRAVQHRCKRDNIRKKSNKYLITDEIIALWKELKATQNANANAMLNAMPNANATQLDLQVQSLQIENENLKHQVDDLRKELSRFDIEEGERMEVFTDAEYEALEQRLIEWRTLQKEIEHKEEVFSLKEQHFNTENKNLSKSLKHYKNQFEYQKKQSTKILDMHQTLIDTIQKQSTITIQRNTIEAIEKNVVNPDTWKPNK